MQYETTREYDDVKCPYCGEKQGDSWELGDGGEGCGEIECQDCEREFQWVREIMVTYKGIPIANAGHLARKPAPQDSDS